MGSALTIGLVSGGLSALSSLGSGMAQSNQQRQQAKAMEVQAANTRAQAEMERQRGQIEAETIAKQKSRLTKEYQQGQARNRVNLAAGNIDMTSGSALKLQEGNADAYAADVGENEYQRLLKINETNNNFKAAQWQADQYDANASYLKRTAGNLGTNLLTAALAGTASGLTSYIGAGGKLFGNETNPIGTDLSNPVGKFYHENVKSNFVSKIRLR